MRIEESYKKTLLDGTWDMVSVMLENIKEIEKIRNKLPYLNSYKLIAQEK